MIGNIIIASSLTVTAWIIAERNMQITLQGKIDVIFYMMIFGLIWSVMELIRMDESVNEAKMIQMYEAGKEDALKGKNEKK